MISYFKGHVDLVIPLDGDQLIRVVKRGEGLRSVGKEAVAPEFEGGRERAHLVVVDHRDDDGEGHDGDVFEQADLVIVAHALQGAEVEVGSRAVPLRTPLAGPIRLELQRRVAELLAGSRQRTPHSVHDLANSVLLLRTPRCQDVDEEFARGDGDVLDGREVALVLEVGGPDDVVVLRVGRGGAVQDSWRRLVPRFGLQGTARDVHPLEGILYQIGDQIS